MGNRVNRCRYPSLLSFLADVDVDDIMESQHLILTNTHIIFKRQIYRQKLGTVVGSPVSLLVANVYMEHI